MSENRDSNIPKALPVIPLRNAVLFPHQFMPIAVAREKSLQILKDAAVNDTTIVILIQKDAATDDPTPDDLITIGTEAKIMRIIDMPDGSKTAILQGLQRMKVITFLQETPFLKAAFQTVSDVVEMDDSVQAMVNNLHKLFRRIVELSNEASYEQMVMISNVKDPGMVADLIIAFSNTTLAEKKEVLEALKVLERLEKANLILTKHLQNLELSEKIQSDIKSKLEKNQREMYLREQLKAIKKELGEDVDGQEITELKQKIKKANMPEEAKKIAEKELDRLSQMHPSSAEYTVSRTYLDWLTELPWSVSTEDNPDISAVEKKLNEDHYGLNKVKNRILEYLAVRKLKKDMRGPILCFVGPPGVGKTSLGKSIANALGRKFVRISLGGIRDEAEIRGHRRTYIGALPGRIIQGINKAKSNNPIFMLDEIDKLGTDFRGDPSSALLEVLDPEQNFSFSDHYLEVAFDLSKVMFIATANVTYTIPPALKDRMEVIEIPSYIVEDKLHIAKSFLVPRQLNEHGLNAEQLTFEDEALRFIIESYTKEAGVRNLEREIAAICRNVAKDFAQQKTNPQIITKEKVNDILGSVKYFPDVAERIDEPGIVTGLAWTPVGGDILFVEASKMEGKGKLILTGHLGDVMKESANAALSYIRSKAKELGVATRFHEKYDIHIHVPSGAVPKDGPSAGITMFIAMVSLFTARKVKCDVAMTGEISLRGTLLPVGGIKEKVIAAHRAGIRQIILPEKNKNDLSEVPQQVKDELTFHFIRKMGEAVDFALEDEDEEINKIEDQVKGEISLN